MVRSTLLVVFAGIVLVSLNFLIFQKEKLLSEGKSMLFALAPRDPRSILQGDYMALNYQINSEISQKIDNSQRDKAYQVGYAVVSLDKNNVATFKRIHDPKISLADGEHLVKYKYRKWSVQVCVESFFFQEGHAKYYDAARYGEIKVTPAGETLLVGLRDEKFQLIVPPKEK